jgi:threonine dehydratase
VTIEDVRSARDRVAGHAHVTPVIASRSLDAAAGAEVFLKCENLQRVGAFKFRGAWNAVSQLSPAQRERGVLTYSSGNHAQAVALAGKLHGVKTLIVMPSTAPVIKRQATSDFGATLRLYDPATESREDIAAALQQEGGFTLIPPFDHAHVIAGQGTAALELHEQAPDLDVLIAPCGGGGLLSGCAVATKAVAPDCRVIGIEPEVADDATRSFRTGVLHRVRNPPTIADGTRTPSLGELTFPLVRRYVDDMQTVSEAAIVEAVRFLFYRLKLVVEPSGALGVAALLSGAVRSTGRVGVIVSGGNVDGQTMAAILNT